MTWLNDAGPDPLGTPPPDPRRYILWLDRVKITVPATMSDEEAERLLNQWEEAWPEIVNLCRRKAAEISHKMEVQSHEA